MVNNANCNNSTEMTKNQRKDLITDNNARIAARIEIFRSVRGKAADICRPIGNPGLFPTAAALATAFRLRHVSAAVTCWTVHVNLIETFRLTCIHT